LYISQTDSSQAQNDNNMNPIGTHNYYVYIVTNKNKTVLYTGVTNNLQARLQQHYTNAQPFTHKSFAGKYNAYNLLYYERFEYIQDAIAREKEIKGWVRSKKEALINTTNPEWRFLNSDIGLSF
jgi:putative endonuclease